VRGREREGESERERERERERSSTPERHSRVPPVTSSCKPAAAGDLHVMEVVRATGEATGRR
jgi:hypothetical protein